MQRLVFQIAAGVLGIWLADRFVSGVTFTGSLLILLMAGIILGLVNFFVKPVLKAVTLPLRIITFGLLSLVINILMVWIVDILFPELKITGLLPLFWMSIIVWGLNLIFTISFLKKN